MVFQQEPFVRKPISIANWLQRSGRPVMTKGKRS